MEGGKEEGERERKEGIEGKGKVEKEKAGK